MSGQRKALIVANDVYEQETLQNLLAPAADAEALGRVLGDPQIGDFAVHVVRNEPAHVIQAQIEEVFSESRPDDLVLLHFSGHGLKSESGELYFAASNTRPNRLGSTAVSADFVQRCMRDSRSRSIVLLLDCCYGGAFAQGARVRAAGDVNVLDSFPQHRSGGGRGRAVITASNAMEYAFEADQLSDDQQRRPSVFTSALVEGLATGDADRDEDGWIALDELYDYVFDKVREQNPHQTPSRRIELEGELYLARSRRQRIRPEPVPADLRAALADPNMYARLGAVTELRSRLAGDNLPAAAGAYEALADLARTATRYLAEPAAEGLRDAAVQPAQTEVHFGPVRQGSAPPHQVVRLLGPPIARACVPRPSGDWIGVEQVAEGLDISIDTASAGPLTGTIAVKGTTGEAVIAVDIELVSASPQAHVPDGPDAEGITVPGPLADQPGEQPAPPVSQPQAAPQHPAWLQPGQQAPGHEHEIATAPSTETGQQARIAPAVPAAGQASHPATGQPQTARESITSMLLRQSNAPFVAAAGSAVLGVLLLITAVLCLLTNNNPGEFVYGPYTPLWQTILAVAVLGALIAGFERPVKQLRTLAHGWNFIWFICLTLYILNGILQYPNVTHQLVALTVAGAVGNAICTAYGLVLVARGARNASNVILCITTAVMTAALVSLAIFFSGIGGEAIVGTTGVILFTASLASLLESAVVLTGRRRSRAGPGAKAL